MKLPMETRKRKALEAGRTWGHATWRWTIATPACAVAATPATAKGASDPPNAIGTVATSPATSTYPVPAMQRGVAVVGTDATANRRERSRVVWPLGAILDGAVLDRAGLRDAKPGRSKSPIVKGTS